MWRSDEKVEIEDYCKDRKDLTPNQQKILLEEVSGRCPMTGCGKSLVNEIDGKIYNQYEIAHVFPNSSDDFQRLHLKEVEVDGDDSESLENKISLCHDCHTKYDDNTTEVSYGMMLDLKRRLAVELKEKKEISRESIEEDILKAISVLSGMRKRIYKEARIYGSTKCGITDLRIYREQSEE